MRRLVTAAVVCATLAIGTTASAEERPQIGVGGHATLAGTSGIGVNFNLSPTLTIHGLFGLVLFSPAEGDSQRAIDLAAGAIYQLADFGTGRVGVGGRLHIANDSAGEGRTHLLIDVPLRGEWFLSPYFSLHTEVGLALSFIPEEGSVTGPFEPTPTGDMEGFKFTTATDLIGNAGFTFYF